MSERDLAFVIGLGRIGVPIYEMLRKAYGTENVHGWDLSWPRCLTEGPYYFLHICFPETQGFIEYVGEYIRKYDPRTVIVHSTLSPGMTKRLMKEFGRWYDADQSTHEVSIFYSPVRGNVKDDMEWSLRHYTKYISGFDVPSGSLQRAAEHLSEAGFRVKTLQGDMDGDALEKAKLWDLAWYGVNIAFYQELERGCNSYEYKIVREFIESTPIESEGRVPRVVFYGGFIGGHCVIPAIRKLLATSENKIPLLADVISSNILRERELTYGNKPIHHP